ncbi:MAG TPA: hypothetical protein VGB52_05920 [Actinomycetota bacterium]
MAAAIILGSSGGNRERLAYGDGLIYRYVAANLTTPHEDIHPVVEVRGTSLRYGRIGLPILIWLGSAGQDKAMPYVQAAILVVATGAASAALVAMFPGLGLLAAVIPFLVPGFVMTLAGGFAECLAVALALWAVIMATRERWWACAGLLSFTLLTRENVAWLALGLFVWLVLRRRFRGAAVLTTAVVPLIGWYAVVAARYGHVPLLDPYLRTETETVGIPLLAPIRSLTDGFAAPSVVTAALHITLAIVAFALARQSTLGFLAGATAAQMLITGPFAWRFAGEGVRTAVFIQTLTLLAVIAWQRPAWTDPALLERLGQRRPRPG